MAGVADARADAKVGDGECNDGYKVGGQRCKVMGAGRGCKCVCVVDVRGGRGVNDARVHGGGSRM